MASPRQDFKDLSGTSGAGGGFFVESTLQPGLTVRSRFDYLSFKEGPGKGSALLPALVPPTTQRLSTTLDSIGAELRAHPVSGLLEDFFLLGGVSGMRAEFTAVGPSGLVDANGQPLPGTVRIKDRTSVKVGLSAGVGLQFCRASALTLRYTTANLTGVTLATLETGLEIRF